MQHFDDAMMSNLSTIAEMATQSVLRARLTEKHLEEARHSRDLAEFARRVARVRTVDGLVDVVMAYGGVPVGSAVTNVGLIDAEGGQLVVQPDRRFPADLVQEFGPRLLGDDLPGMTAIRTGEPVVMGTPEEIARRHPGRFADAAAMAGIRSTAHLPLVGADATPLGSIGFGWDGPRELSDTTMATLFTIAELCAQTLERVRLGEAEHDLVSSLQHRVVRPLPPAPGLSLAQRYRPAAHSVGMGGDWYEGIALVDGRYAVVVGDIAGHGIAAVADMIQVRAVVGTLLRGGVPLGDVFPQATGLLDDRRSTVTATAGIVVVDPAAEELSYVMAGHLPPVVIAPAGGATFLNDGRQPLLGVPIAPVVPGSAPFPAGSTLIAYTDGLIERRTESIDRSLQRVLDAADSSPGSTPQAVADHLLDTCLAGEDPDDDVALVVVRLDT